MRRADEYVLEQAESKIQHPPHNNSEPAPPRIGSPVDPFSFTSLSGPGPGQTLSPVELG